MKDPLKQFLQPNPLDTNLFPPNSRYYGTQTATMKTAGAKEGETQEVIYLLRRFIPPAHVFTQVDEHTVVQGDRTDNIATQYHNDPEQFWLICDANCVMRPRELIQTPGEKIRITLPEGIPGGSSG